MATLRWRKWAPEVFAEAKQRDLPILLAVMTPWNEKCRDMDASTYSDSRVVKAIEASMIPLRVDGARRPDIRARYEMGGLPATAFLTPQGHLLTGASFLRPDEMLDAIVKVSAYYAGNRETLLAEVGSREMQAALSSEPQGMITSGTVTKVEKIVVAAHDQANGGFSGVPKRLHSDAIRLLLLRYFRTSDKTLSDLAAEILREVCASPLRDQVDGGFFHQAMAEDWSEIDRAKTAKDNSDIARVLTAASRATGDEGLETVAGETIAWALGALTDPDGTWYAALMPDSDYYELGEAEREARTGPHPAEVVLVEPAAMMATACLDAAVGLGAKDAGTVGLAAGERLWKEAFDAKSGMSHSIEPMLADRSFGLLGDQLRMLELLIRTFEVGGHVLHQRRAIALAGLIETLFGDSGGGFFDRIPEDDAIGHLKFRKKSLADNGLAAQLFQRLGALTHNEHFREVAASALRRFTDEIESHGLLGASIAIGCDGHMRGLTEVMVVGPRSARETARLRLGALETFSPVCVVNLVDPEADPQTLKIRDVEFDGSPVAYIYHGGERLGPISEREELGEAVLQAGRS